MSLSPRELRRLLKRMGLQDLEMEEVRGISKVIMYMTDGSMIEINNPNVAQIKVSGMVIYQVQSSEPDIKVSKPTKQPGDYVPTEDDIKLVMEETQCSREEAIEALRRSGGDIAEAILSIQKSRSTQ